MIYLNNAATSWPKPSSVCEAVQACLMDTPASQFRGGSEILKKDTEERCREKLGKLLGVHANSAADSGVVPACARHVSGDCAAFGQRPVAHASGPYAPAPSHAEDRAFGAWRRADPVGMGRADRIRFADDSVLQSAACGRGHAHRRGGADHSHDVPLSAASYSRDPSREPDARIRTQERAACYG